MYRLDTTLDIRRINYRRDAMKTDAATFTGHILEQLQSYASRSSERTCVRCSGLLVVDDCLDILGDAGEIECRVLRCIQCGDVTDPVIMRNRTQPPVLQPRKFVKWSSAKLTAMARR